MGNAEIHDLGPVRKDERKELDLSVHVDYRNYCKHINGEFSYNCLKEVPCAILDSISLHERLNLSFNCLQTLPTEIPFRLPHLSFVDVSYNQITVLPDSIGLLFHLQELLLTHNLLITIPSTFVHLVKLEKIDLSHNVLEDLPEAIGQMESLKKLNLSHNKLKLLPRSLGCCRTLQVLLASSNNCESQPPQSICDQGSEAILRFLKQLALGKIVLNSKNSENVFPRVRGNGVQSSIPNAHSARAQYVQMQTETMNTASRIRTPLLPPLNATALHPDKLKDRLIGLIYGAVIGDAVGIATEFLTADECMFHYDEKNLQYESIICDEHRAHWRKGDWTSNSDQMLLVLDSLLHWAGVIDELEFAKGLIFWKKNGFPELGNRESYMYSNTINLVLQEENYAQNPHQVSQYIHQRGMSERTNGNCKAEISDSPLFVDSGALPRAVILGIPRFHDLDEVISNSVRICLATHHDERCLASCVGLTVVVALMLQGKHSLDDSTTLNELLQTAEAYGLKYINDNCIKEEFQKSASCKDLNSLCVNEVGKLCHTFKPYATALYALQQQKDFRSTLSSILMQGGYSSMNGCISGALLGCKFGFSKLPKAWVDGLRIKNKELLNSKINALLDMMGLP